MASDISFIFPVYNGGTNPINLVASIYKQKYPQSRIEIICVDNNSTDKSTLALHEKYPQVKIITLPINLGFPKAINLGLASSTGEYCFILNDDVTLPPHCSHTFTNYLASHPQTAAVGGTNSGFKFDFTTGKIYQSDIAPDWISAHAIMLPKKILYSTGLFDERFTPGYFEDADLGFRIRKAGFSLYCHPHVHITHLQNASFSKLPKWKFFWYWHKSKIKFILKHAYDR
jgi:GT2 family glycosyltransferase